MVARAASLQLRTARRDIDHTFAGFSRESRAFAVCMNAG